MLKRNRNPSTAISGRFSMFGVSQHCSSRASVFQCTGSLSNRSLLMVAKYVTLVALLVVLASSIRVHSAEVPTLALTPAEVLVEEGRKFGANIVKSPLSPFLSKLAAEHAREVCNGKTPHCGFSNRAARARRGRAGEISEIVSPSWRGQSVREGGHDAWKSWKTSRAHWRTANGKPKLYGASMIRDRKGRWVAVIIASWR